MNWPVVVLWLLGGVLVWDFGEREPDATEDTLGRWLAIALWPAVAAIMVAVGIFDFFHTFAHRRDAI
jgi:hypothetical protein